MSELDQVKKDMEELLRRNAEWWASLFAAQQPSEGK